jgi:putative peptidoglycan lipid II flippase
LLAVSTGLSALVNAALLFRGLRRDGIFSPSGEWRRLLPQVGLASLAMGGFLWWISGDWSEWTGWPAMQRALWLTVCVVGGGTVYFAMLWICGARPRHLKPL